MAVAFLSTANTFLSLSSSPSSSSSFCTQKHNNVITQQSLVPICCIKATEREPALASPSLSKRNFALFLSSAFLLPLVANGGPEAEAAVLEAEDDLELLEKVKQDRKKRIEKQGIINSSKQETGYLQDVVYKLSAVGQAIENNDLSAASSVLGTSTNTEWIKKANSAFSKLSSSSEEKTEIDLFNTSISKLISSVDNKDMDSSKVAFVSSALAFEKWTALTGLGDKLKGL